MISEEEIKKNKKEILELFSFVKREGKKNLINWLSESNFFTSPASTMFHGNYKGGLAKHSLMVYQEFDRLIEYYSLDVPRESRIISGIFHDCCKIDFYEDNLLKSGNISESKPYKTKDLFPIGHGEKSVMLLQKYISPTEQEAILIRWHMGFDDPAWNDYREKVEASYPEVILFQHADKQVSSIRRV